MRFSILNYLFFKKFYFNTTAQINGHSPYQLIGMCDLYMMMLPRIIILKYNKMHTVAFCDYTMHLAIKI